MATLSIRLPNSLHRQLRECAKNEGTSINQLVSSAVGEKLAALMTEQYLETRGRRSSRRKFEAALKTIPDIDAPDFDRLPTKQQGKGARSRVR